MQHLTADGPINRHSTAPTTGSPLQQRARSLEPGGQQHTSPRGGRGPLPRQGYNQPQGYVYEEHDEREDYRRQQQRGSIAI